MKRPPLFTVAPIAACALAAALSACGAGSDAESRNGSDVVKVGTVPVADVAPLYLGIEKGFFTEESLEIEPMPGQGGPTLIAGVMSDSLDIGISASTPLVQARATELPVVAIATAGANLDTADGGRSALVVPGESDIEDASDLADAKVAVNGLKSVNELLVRADVDHKGGDASTLEFVEIPFPDMEAALSAGRVDAVAITEPFLSTMLAAGDRALLYYGEDVKGPGVPATYWFTSEAQLDQSGDLFERFCRAWEKSATYAQEHPDEVREILTTYAGLNQEQVEAMQLPNFTGQLDIADFQQDATLMVEYHFLDKLPDLDGLVRDPRT